MRLQHLKITNFLGCKFFASELSPFTIVAGPNWSGKTSIQQAIRLVLTGEVARVELKGEYKQLIREGQKTAHVEASWVTNADAEAIMLRADLSTASTGHMLPNIWSIHPALLDQHRFSRSTSAERRAILYELAHVLVTEASITAELAQADADMARAAELLPLLSAGFDAMHKYAEGKATEARAEWKALAGETYGEKKAETWQASAAQIVSTHSVAAEALPKRGEIVGLVAERLAEYEPQVAKMRQELLRAAAKITCPHCALPFRLVTQEREDELRLSLPEHEAALEMLRRSKANAERDLEDSRQAVNAIRASEKACEATTEKALAAHRAACAWRKLRDLLAPEGIPSNLLAGTLASLNDWLRASAAAIGLGQASVGTDFSVRKDGRPYGLLSESEQWLVDAMLVEALSHVAKAGFVMLDRLDVLDVAKRLQVVTWLIDLTEAEGLQAIVFGTLKAAPKLGDGRLSIWIGKE
jgi:DNA repair exonuclease SbcCD ATPase subunit